MIVFFVKKKTSYEMRISDWSSGVCSSDLGRDYEGHLPPVIRRRRRGAARPLSACCHRTGRRGFPGPAAANGCIGGKAGPAGRPASRRARHRLSGSGLAGAHPNPAGRNAQLCPRSEEHTSELQSLMRISYADLRLKKKQNMTQAHKILTNN